ncbi:DUF3168 domain-containing protein [Sphingobium sp. BYY-5]|uniref:DUF3168 domain-containing protein n=1 Tax=Sphingobium sp. BYY-5 TaxID=2926400 RepID=UPI001FA7A13B|nr:DUF3168 domain-containing protein [Sphingobium sp. BYY-5]MCI4589847.1 DUF3168 domain-containing protein [Sphingobium sp. BYY-5]
MSAEVAVRAAVLDALRADGALMAAVNGVYDGEPGRAAAPYGHVGECLGADWGGKEVEGRELRLTIGLAVAEEGPGRLGGMIARVDPAIQAAGARDGWRIVSARLLRSRVARGGTGAMSGWRAVVDYRIRAVRE